MMAGHRPVPIDVIASVGARHLASLHVSDGFAAVVRAEGVARVLRAVIAIGGTVTVAVAGDLLVGYVTILPIEPIRWGGNVYHRRWEALTEGRELGSIEVSRSWRGRKLGERLILSAFSGGTLEATIVISQELSWHWDYENLHMTKREYRAMLVRLLGKAGFQEFHTDDPNIASDHANIFMARIGPLVSAQERERFHALLVTGQSY